MEVLILGGTGLARRLAGLLVAAGRDVTTSLAGVTEQRRSLPGDVRVGGFGGVDGLVGYLEEFRPALLVDATHPFAGSMSDHAAAASARLGLPLLRLQQPSWGRLAEAAGWTWVIDHDEAARAAAVMGGRVLLTVGRQPVPHYLDALADRSVIVRCIDAPDARLPLSWTVLRGRGPFDLDGERNLLARVDVLVSKDAGGADPDPKLVAATEFATRVIMIRRPAAPAYGDEAASPQEALRWIGDRLPG